MSGKGEIRCSACGEISLLRREPLYEGFRRVGETLRCMACGHAYASEADVPFTQRPAPRVFGDEDRSAPVQVFAEGERAALCRHCVHYVVNPFAQRCDLHRRFVEATDTCPQFTARTET